MLLHVWSDILTDIRRIPRVREAIVALLAAIERGEDYTTTDDQVVQLGYSLPQPSRIPVNASALMPRSAGLWLVWHTS
jgi:hypothetical protein